MWVAAVLIAVYMCYCFMCLCAAWDDMLTDEERAGFARRLCPWRTRRRRRPPLQALDGCFAIDCEDVVSMEVII